MISNMSLFASQWMLEKNQAWLDISSTGGTLQSGETVTVLVGINKQALDLKTNTYVAELQLQNLNGFGNTTRSVELSISMAGQARLIAPVFPDLFPFAITLTGDPGISYRIEKSNDLISWSAIGTHLIPDSGIMVVVDPEALLSPQQFYRAVEVNP
jgi:hypothetical protein